MSYIIALFLHFKLSLDSYSEQAAMKSDKPAPFFSLISATARDRAIASPLVLALLAHFFFFVCGNVEIIPEWLATIGMWLAGLAMIPALYVGVMATMLIVENDVKIRRKTKGG